MAAGFRNNQIIDFRSKKTQSDIRNRMQNFLHLAVTTLGCNILSLLWTLAKIFKSNSISPKIRRIIILGFGGIGNHLMLTPAIKNVKKTFPEIKLHIVVTSKACAEVLQNNKDIDTMSITNIALMKRLSQYIKVGLILRKFKPDVVISAAGTDPVAGSVISYISGAKSRIGEDWRGRGFLYTLKLKANSKISEIKQNNRLVGLIDTKEIVSDPILNLTVDEINDARKWIEGHKLPAGTKIIGIHPGSGKGQAWKRWDIENFVAVSKKVSLLSDVRVLFFLGPDETELYSILNSAKPKSAIILKSNGSIRETAAKISLCNSILSNDSGLRHIALALDVNSIGIFGPTSIEKNHYGKDIHKPIFKTNAFCSPCHFTSWWLACKDTRPCLTSIEPELVAQALMDSI